MPHSAVLKRSGLLVSHAGHGIVAKALYFGVPMVLVPWDVKSDTSRPYPKAKN